MGRPREFDLALGQNKSRSTSRKGAISSTFKEV